MYDYIVSPYLEINDNDDAFFHRVIDSHHSWVAPEQSLSRASGQALAALTYFSADNQNCALFYVDVPENPIYLFVTPEEAAYIEGVLDRGERQVVFTWGVVEIAYQ